MTGGDEDAPALGHGVAGVDAQVEQGVLQLGLVHQQGLVVRQAAELHLDGRPHGALNQVEQAAHQLVDLGGFRGQGLAAGEGQQPMGQGRGALGAALGSRQVFFQLGEAPLANSQAHEVEAARDPGEQVVEIVGQAAGELADRFHLLRLAQGLFRAPQFFGAFFDPLLQGSGQVPQVRQGAVALVGQGPAGVHVQQHAGKAQRGAIRRQFDVAVGLQPVVAAVTAADPVLVGIAATAADDVGDGRGQAGLVVRMDGGHHLRQAQAIAPQGRVEAEVDGEGLVDGEPVGGQIPVPGADDGAGGEGQLHALGGGQHAALRGAGAVELVDACGKLLFEGQVMPPQGGLGHIALTVGLNTGGGLGGDVEHADDALAIAQRAVGKAPVGVLGIAVAGHHEVLVDEVQRLAGQRPRDQRRDLVPQFRPDLVDRQPQGGRMAGAEKGGVGLVVDQRLLGAPGGAHGEGRRHQQVVGGPKGHGPAGARAQWRGFPGETFEIGQGTTHWQRHGGISWPSGPAARRPDAHDRQVRKPPASTAIHRWRRPAHPRRDRTCGMLSR